MIICEASARIAAYSFTTFLCLINLSSVYPAFANPKEKEYDDAVVLLIDAPSGMLGVEVEDENTSVKKKMSFVANPTTVYVTNPANQIFDLSAVKPGDRVDLVVSIDKNGKEEVTDITDYNQFEKP